MAQPAICMAQPAIWWIKPLQPLALGLVLTLTLTFGPELDNFIRNSTKCKIFRQHASRLKIPVSLHIITLMEQLLLVKYTLIIDKQQSLVLLVTLLWKLTSFASVRA